MIQIHMETKPRRVEEANTGTREQGRDSANSHGDRAEEGGRSDRKHSVNSLWERDESCMLVGASIASSRGVRGSTEVGSR